MIRKSVCLLLFGFVILNISACFSTRYVAPIAPTPSAVVLDDIVAKIGARYDEQHPQVISVNPTFADPNGAPMCFVTLQGNFHKGALQATGLEFSMLTNGAEIWALRAFTSTNAQVWVDSTVPVTH